MTGKSPVGMSESHQLSEGGTRDRKEKVLTAARASGRQEEKSPGVKITGQGATGQ